MEKSFLVGKRIAFRMSQKNLFPFFSLALFSFFLPRNCSSQNVSIQIEMILFSQNKNCPDILLLSEPFYYFATSRTILLFSQSLSLLSFVHPLSRSHPFSSPTFPISYRPYLKVVKMSIVVTLPKVRFGQYPS